MKNGPCKFTIFKNEKELAVYYGEFNNNIENYSSSNYGQRI